MNPESEIWRSKGFPLYDEILPLVEGRHATGELVYHAPEPNSSIAGDFGHENRDAMFSLCIERVLESFGFTGSSFTHEDVCRGYIIHNYHDIS